MKYPILSEMNTSREWLDVFKGYNHNLRISDGEFYEMENLSSDNYPLLSPRSHRGIYASPFTPQGMASKDSLIYIDGKNLVINKYPTIDTIDMELTVDKDDEGKTIPKTLISMGAYVIIMPDKKYINTLNYYDKGDIEATFTTKDPVTFTLCKADGNPYENTQKGETAPEITEEMKSSPSTIPLWLDISSVPHQLKQYSTSTSMWSTIATTYIRIESATENIGLPFSVNDGVSISGVTSDKLQDLNASMVIWAKDDQEDADGNKISKWIVVKGILDEVTEQETPICICRWMPDFDYIVESGNRLWGCKYGLVRMGKAYNTETKTTNDVYSPNAVNEIYACKLGDFKNWNCFMGISTDSYVASVGTDGVFTGAITHLGYPLFFKENFMHKVYGNYPANYHIQTTDCRGVQMDCGKSLAIVNEVLYYKARTGICAYDGSLPMEISSALGDMNYSKAVAGSLGNKYYVCMKDTTDQYHLFVYDTLKGMWHREDSTEVLDFCNCRGDLYYIDWADKQIKTVRGTGVTEIKPVKWSATTGVIGTDSPDKKYVSRLDVRMKLAVGSRVTFFVEYDSSGTWEYLFTKDGVNLESFSAPIKPKRCDHMRLRITGEGDAKIYSICKTIEWGSDK